MMYQKKLFILSFLVSLFLNMSVFAASSAVDQVRQTDMSVITEPFLKMLGINYRSFALYETEIMGDEKDSDFFAKKALAVYQGTLVPPEDPANWKIPLAAQAELNDSFQQLKNALAQGSAQRYPDLSAEAQAKFDCWIEQQEENWQWEHIEACRQLFKEAMAELSARLGQDAQAKPQAADQSPVQPLPYVPPYQETDQTGQQMGAGWPQNIINIYNCLDGACIKSNSQQKEIVNQPSQPEPAQPVETITTTKTEDDTGKVIVESVDSRTGEVVPSSTTPGRNVEIFFDWNRDEIKPEWKPVLRDFANNLRELHPNAKLRIEGHTDTSGPAAYNVGLSQRRAKAVRDELMLYGIGADQMYLAAKGEAELKIPTVDGIREPQNRRATMVPGI